MKEQVGKTDGEHFASHWLTIQPSLFNFIEDEVGELDENQRLFVRLAESVELGRIAAKYGWRGNGRKPSSRLAMFKLLLVDFRLQRHKGHNSMTVYHIMSQNGNI